ncbi:MAG: hypothetical protein WDZ63_12880 [Burkholderiales bacterium]
MKTISRFTLIAGGMLAASVASAQSDATTSIKTRSVEAAHADLMRDWSYRPAADELPGGLVRVRTAADAYADLIRDWQGVTRKNAAVEARRPAVSRTANVMNNSGRS